MTKKTNNVKKITLSLTDETEEELRHLAETKYHGMRGALSMIVESALQEYFKKLREE